MANSSPTPCRWHVRLVIIEKNADTLTMVDTADSLKYVSTYQAAQVNISYLCKDIANLEHFQLLFEQLFVLCLVHAVRDDDLVERARLDPLNRVSAEDAVGDECVHLVGALFLEQLGRTRDGVARVGQIVNQNRGAVGYIANKHHGRVLPLVDLSRATLLFVYQ
jgi:hypothetical protein